MSRYCVLCDVWDISMLECDDAVYVGGMMLHVLML